MADQFLSESDYGLLRREKCSNMTDDQFAVFRHAIERFRLDPFANQIYATVRRAKNGKETIVIQTGIDGYRLIADRTGLYAGNDDPTFDKEQNPTKATVSVYKVVGGLRCAYTASARWDQYYPGDVQGMMWKKMPHLMLGKCAEALALRKAFPAELAGLYTTEEMQQADQDQPPSKPAEAPAEAPADNKPGPKEEVWNNEIAKAKTINRTIDLWQSASEKIPDPVVLARIKAKITAKLVFLFAQIATSETDITRLTSWGSFIPTCELLTPEQQNTAMQALLAREQELNDVGTMAQTE